MPPRQVNKNPAQAATAPKAKAKRVKVEATQTGYYDHARRREGDVFIIDDCDFSEKWMKRAPTGAAPSISTAQQNIDKQHDEILAANSARPATALDEEGL
jgi:2-phospho-L-lactate transferase/gluconeogenesis factor (CofD/UPF0052 family)